MVCMRLKAAVPHTPPDRMQKRCYSEHEIVLGFTWLKHAFALAKNAAASGCLTTFMGWL